MQVLRILLCGWLLKQVLIRWHWDPYYTRLSSTSLYSKNIIVASCLKIWTQFRCFLGLQAFKGAISVIYSSIHKISSNSSLNISKTVWETDLGQKICRILHRAHYTKTRLSKIYNTVSSLCDPCKQAPANCIHKIYCLVCYPLYFAFLTIKRTW